MIIEQGVSLNERYRCNLCGCDYYEEDIPKHIHDDNFDSFVINERPSRHGVAHE